MKNASYIVIAGIVLLLLVGGYFMLRDEDNTSMQAVQNAQQERYASDTYGFSFAIPEDYEYTVYTEDAIDIGTATTSGFTGVANVRVYASLGEGGYENFEAFVFESLKNACAADGPAETIFCSEVEDKEGFTTDSGVAGTQLSLRRVYQNLATGEERVDSFGPIFVFDLRGNVTDSDFALLAVHPPANMPSSEVQHDLVRALAQSVAITAFPSQTGN